MNCKGIHLMLASLLVALALIAGAGWSAQAGPGPTVIHVNSTADTADAAPGNGVCATATPDCTLRAALQEATTCPGALCGVPVDIEFSIPSTAAGCSSGVCTITVLADLPHLNSTAQIRILGFSQKTQQPTNCTQFAGAGVVPFGLGPCIVINGNAGAYDGLTLASDASGQGHFVEGVAIVNFDGHGIKISAGKQHVQNCYLGIAADGVTGGVANANTADGVNIDPADENVIGPGNVISNNGHSGLDISGSRNKVIGNFIGTDATGLVAKGNGVSGIEENNGVTIRNDSDDNEIGGTTLADRNVISGNIGTVGEKAEGIEIEDSASERNEILGNIIGLGIDGTTSLGNGSKGVEDNGTATCYGGRNDTNSGTTCTPKAGALLPNGSAGNLISSNTDGIEVDGGSGQHSFFGNFIGTDINGTACRGNKDDGIDINTSSADNNLIGGTTALEGNLISCNGEDSSDNGIEIDGGANNNLILGNIIGLNRFGDATAGLGNFNDGIHLFDNSTGNCIGGTTLACTADSAASRNLISRNGNDGVKTEGDSNTVRGNYIGLNKAGDTAAPNGGDGVDIDPSDNNVIGPNNVISSNVGNGVIIDGDSNVVKGNLIGTDATGTVDLGNGLNGVLIIASATSDDNGNGPDSERNTIGGTSAADRNVISGNGQNGVRLTDDGISNSIQTEQNSILGNYIGTNAAGTAAIPNDEDGVHLDAPSNSGDVNDNCIGGLIDPNDSGDNPACIPQSFSGGGLANGLAGNLISGNGTASVGGDSNGSDNGVEVTGGSDDNSVISNFIGLNAAGTAAIPNRNNGIYDNSDSFTCIGSSQNDLGGGCVPISGVINGRNIISGNLDNGIKFVCFAPPNCATGFTNNQVIANYIGTDWQGKFAVPNGNNGVFIDPDSFNTIGGNAATNPLVRNVISGNLANGVQIAGLPGPPLTVTSRCNAIQGNFIGTAADGSSPLGNKSDGVQVTNGAQDHTSKPGVCQTGSPLTQFNAGIGDGAVSDSACNPGLANVIAFNGGAGVHVDGGQTFHITIRCNSIHDNIGKGILLTDGANNGILPPTVTATSTIDGKANVGDIVDGYNDNNGEGRTYIGEDLADTNCNGAGICEFTVALHGSNPLPNATATQTDNLGDTSEFSNSLTTLNCVVTAISSPTTLKFYKNGSKYVYITVQNQGILAAEITGIAGLIAKNLSIKQIKFGKKTLLPPFDITLPPATQQTFKVKLQSSVKQTVSAPFVNVVGNCHGFNFNAPALEGDEIGLISAIIAPLKVEQLSVKAQAGQLVAAAQGVGIQSVQLQVYNTTGRLLADQVAVGAKVILAPQSQLANGVYLAVLTVRGQDGKLVRSELKKFVIQR